MYHVINNQNKIKITGFTLIELLVAIAIIGVISVISVQGLFDIVSLRAKQQTIESSSDSFRVIARLITKSVIEAERINIPNSQEIKLISDTKCQTIKYDTASSSIVYSTSYPVPPNPCSAPNTGFVNITDEDFVITDFTLSPTGNPVEVVLLEMKGSYKNSLGDHPIKYSTTISKRI